MKSVSAHIVDARRIENRLLELSSSRSFFALYTSRGYPNSHKKFELVFGWGAKEHFDSEALKKGGFEQGWKFGYLSYELRHKFEQLDSGNPALGEWPDAHFFTPEIAGTLALDGTLTVYADSEEKAAEVLIELQQLPQTRSGATTLEFKPVERREQYLEAVKSLQEHIQRGDIYEINYCTAFVADVQQLDEPLLFQKMVSATDAPFSGYLKLGTHSLLCSSPERYISKTGSRVLTQPIKGTNRRAAQDNHLAQQALVESEKERAENVMIVDLVRNDLSHVAAKGSVEVSELFGTYAFKNVNQLISTVQADLREGVSNWEIISTSFPMGSMTGAPKISAMQLAERYEKSAREIYSGAIGYIAPNGDFDLNVVIRSIAVNHAIKKATVHVGGAITILSDPEAEYEECLLKAESLLQSAR